MQEAANQCIVVFKQPFSNK